MNFQFENIKAPKPPKMKKKGGFSHFFGRICCEKKPATPWRVVKKPAPLIPGVKTSPYKYPLPSLQDVNSFASLKAFSFSLYEFSIWKLKCHEPPWNKGKGDFRHFLEKNMSGNQPAPPLNKTPGPPKKQKPSSYCIFTKCTPTARESPQGTNRK